ncbi:hypothetical protein B0H67DRAFT_561175 [Lasiosphaeris hirsuta]|uniref:Secreted protein n=1 Tax=Lasiosphaeris hirsuta TaxID=260670 RepID=A0AA40B9R2_9PEZI|nr:hypothetical protein B0H67DRAFT_561175 [Lasiosphaeris hirsuta]
MVLMACICAHLQHSHLLVTTTACASCGMEIVARQQIRWRKNKKGGVGWCRHFIQAVPGRRQGAECGAEMQRTKEGIGKHKKKVMGKTMGWVRSASGGRFADLPAG